MFKLVVPGLVLLCCTGLAVSWQDPTVRPAAAAPATNDGEVRDLIKTYVDTFNKRDAKALAEFWSPEAVSVDSETGSRLVGRDAIRAGFEARLKESPNGRLAVRLNAFRFLKPDILTIEGTSIFTEPNEAPDETNFTALLVRNGDRWQIEQATESPPAHPASAHDALRKLEWIVGTWADDSPGVRVETEAKWSDKKNFLIRKYTVTFDGDAEPVVGTQIIGWDPRARTIRSWTFSEDGSFGEGTWSFADNEWRVKVNNVQADGDVTSGTQILTRVDGRTVKVQMVGEEVNGELAPTRPAVTMVRKEAASETKP
jgi:uncharacterized protein (TIGR02246 family)